MQTTIVYIIGIVAVSYLAMTIWKKIKGQGSCCSTNGSSGCCGCSAAGTECKDENSNKR